MSVTLSPGTSNLHRAIERFGGELPYKRLPFSKRNWGHPLHSLCSYQGKLKPAIANWLVSMFTEKGDLIVDPLGGVGTIPFEACALGRVGISNDLSPLAYAVATAKVRAPAAAEVEFALRDLESGLEKIRLTEPERASATFGLNGSVADFFHPLTLDEILRARRFFIDLEHPTDAQLFVKAALLHVLHGNRPYALSRKSHPITPFHPTGPVEYKPLIGHVQQRVGRMFREPLPDAFTPGQSFQGDFRNLRSQGVGDVDHIITSPPFWGMRFDRPNWLRLWFCGWEENDFHQTSRGFLERQQVESLDVYRQFFRTCRELLRPGGTMVIHLGGSDRHNQPQHLAKLAGEVMELVGLVTEDVTSVENHGIKDKGLTTSHNFLFFRAES